MYRYGRFDGGRFVGSRGYRQAFCLATLPGNDTPADGRSTRTGLRYRNYRPGNTEIEKELYTIIADHSGRPYEQIEKDSDRDYWMTAAEAKEYGMIDEVLVRAKNK